MNEKDKLAQSISEADEIQLDIIFSVMKREELGIRKKIRCLARIFNLNEEKLLDSFPKADDNRPLDKKSRAIIFKMLLDKTRQ